jgi:chromosomal replication initiation ATPase DnaA
MDAATTIRRELMNAIGQDRFELWFESNAHWMIEDESLVIIARDEFSSDRIRKAFGRDLQRATQKVLGVGSRVRFDVNSVESATENPSPVEPIGVSSIKVDSAVGDSNEEVLTEGCANEQDLLSDGNLAKQVFDVDQASIAVRPLVNLPNTSSLPRDSLANDHVTQKNLVLFDTSVVNASEENNAVISTTLPHPRLSEKNRRTRMSLDSFVVDPANSLAFRSTRSCCTVRAAVENLICCKPSHTKSAREATVACLASRRLNSPPISSKPCDNDACRFFASAIGNWIYC